MTMMFERVGQDRVRDLPAVGAQAELLDRREDHLAAARGAAGRATRSTLSACLTSPTSDAHGDELVKELVVEVGAIHLDDERSGSPAPDARRSRPTRKTIDSDLPEPVVCQMTPSRRSSRRGRGLDRLRRGLADGEELVVLRALLGDLLVGDLERMKSRMYGQQPLFREQPLDQASSSGRSCPARCARRRSTSMARTIPVSPSTCRAACSRRRSRRRAR